MKRYDEYVGIESRRTGVFTSAKNYGLEEIKKVDNQAFKILVRCRNCGNIHDIKDNCQCCDIETKVKK